MPNIAGEIYATLLAMRDRAGEHLYERLRLADQLLSDREWVRSPDGGGGDESRAIDRLEANCFGDICGALSLPEMLELFHKVPDQKVWKQNKYNLRKMHAEMLARQSARQNTRTRAAAAKEQKESGGNVTTPSEESEKPEAPVETDRDTIKRLKRQLYQRAGEIRRLTQENKKLRRAVKKLQAALAELQPV